MNNLDIELPESMRNVYFTFLEQVDSRFNAFFNIGMSSQRIRKLKLVSVTLVKLTEKILFTVELV